MNRYLLLVLTLTALSVIAVGSFNYIVDPLLLYNEKNSGVEKLSRIDQFANMRTYKPHHVNQRRPDAIVIGSSRSGTLRPNHASWQAVSGYNFSLPGATIFELYRAVLRAHANHPLQRLMIGLDYAALITSQPIYRSGFESSRLARASTDFRSPAYIMRSLRDIQATLFSVDGAVQSVRALSPAKPIIRTFQPDGSWQAARIGLAGRGGYLYVAKTQLNAAKNSVFGSDANLEILRQLLDFCYQNNIETKIFFTPMHAFFLDLRFQMASEDLWYTTHREIVKLNTSLAHGYGRQAFDIWGFGDDSDIVAEPIYHKRQIEQAWFNDGIHYRLRLADAIMETMWGASGNIGQKLTDKNIDAYLNSAIAIKDSFIASNQQLVDDLHSKLGLDE